jgi:peptidoglycan/LPS O-acetylase OafA/YrhL
VLYRAEIDGLRALAVIPVILFHAGFDFAQGGFIGVDVFFVISGYLITSMLIEDLKTDSFKIKDFYERRARRILPALFLVIFVCIPFSYAWLLPKDLLDFSQSISYVLFFSSNILFWSESGYFGTASELKPLLHTWSLAVEEQFYLLFPLFLVVIWPLGKSKVFLLIATGCILSLLLSEWGWRTSPTANFYLAPTRAWELLFGSCAAFLVIKRGVKDNNILSFFGLLLIVFSVLTFSEHLPAPSIYTFIPVLGVFLIICYGGKDTIVSQILSAKFMVGVGLVSYSAYLWHQPIFALYKYRFDTSTLGFIFLVFLCFILAYLTWRFVENPFRNRNKVSSGQLVKFIVICFVFLGTFSLAIQTNTFEARTVFRQDPYNGQVIRRSIGDVGGYQTDFESEAVLWGDSFADALAIPLLDALQDTGLGFESYIKHSCPSLFGVIRNEAGRLGRDFSDECIAFNENVKKMLSKPENKGKKIIITSSYFWYENATNSLNEPILVSSTGHESDVVINSLLDVTLWAKSVGLVPIVILSPPSFDEFPNILRKSLDVAKEYNVTQDDIRLFNKRSRLALERLDVDVIDPLDVLCSENLAGCNVFSNTDNEFIVWYDGSHLSEFGGRKVADVVAERLFE